MAPGIDAASMTYWEFTARKATWNARHSDDEDDGGEVAAPSREQMKRAMEGARAAGIAH